MHPKSPRSFLCLLVLAAGLGGCGPSPASLAQRELQAARQLTDPQSNQDPDQSARMAILAHARRAAQLDPSSEEARYLIVMHADAALPPERDKNAVERASIVLPACQAYLERLGSTVFEHHSDVLNRHWNVVLMAFLSIHRDRNLDDEHVWTVDDQDDDILREPDVRAYRYATDYIRAMAELGYLGELDQRYNSGNLWAAFSYHLIGYLIPSCPADKLDAEYAYWEGFWRDHKREIEHAGESSRATAQCATRPLPWGIVAAAFAARKKDAQGVRRAFQQAALEIPSDDVNVWGGDNFHGRFVHVVPLYMKAAGDPEWETWQPKFPGDGQKAK